MSGVEVDNPLPLTATHDVSNDVGKINKDECEAKIMDAPTLGNGQPEQNSSPVVVKNKSVVDTVVAQSLSEINAAKHEEPIQEKHDTNGSPSPVKRKQVTEKSDSETEDRGSPAKKPRSEVAEHLSDEVQADTSVQMSDEDVDSGEKTSPKRPKLSKPKPTHYVDEELEPGLLEQPIILEEGQKRAKKKVQRLEVTPPSTSGSKKKRLSIDEGSGEKLGDIPRIEYQLVKTLSEDLKPLHRLLFNTTPLSMEVKKNIRQFSGFAFSDDSVKRKNKVDKLKKYTMPMLKLICETLDIERGGNKEDIIERIMSFLMKPKSSGKELPKPSVKRKHKSKKGDDSKGSAKKPKVKKSKTKQTKELVEENDADDEGNKAAADSDKEIKKSDDAETPKPAKKKSKKAETPAKRTPKAEKKTPKSSSAKKVKKSPKKQKVAALSGDSSDDDGDEPLVKKKVPPTDDMLKSVVKKILKTANLEEVTMKTVCKQVYDKFPDFDLTSRKDFIKATVKQILK